MQSLDGAPQWKIAQIIIIQKSGKWPAELTESYKSINLLTILLKLSFEKLLLPRLIIMERLIFNHEFAF